MDLTAVILAAGRGRRLHALTADRPKCLVEIGGVPLIERQLAVLRQAGVLDIVVATGYRRDRLGLAGTREVFNSAWRTTNMVATLFCAEADFGRDLVVAYGDIVYEPRILAGLLESPHDVSVVVDLDWKPYWEMRFGDPLRDAESLRMAGDRILDIGRRVADVAEIEAQYIGLMRFKGRGIETLKAARSHLGTVPRPWMGGRTADQAYMTDLLMEMVILGFEVRAVPVNGGWIEIDTVEDYDKTNAMIADGTIRRFFDPAAFPAP